MVVEPSTDQDNAAPTAMIPERADDLKRESDLEPAMKKAYARAHTAVNPVPFQKRWRNFRSFGLYTETKTCLIMRFSLVVRS